MYEITLDKEHAVLEHGCIVGLRLFDEMYKNIDDNEIKLIIPSKIDDKDIVGLGSHIFQKHNEITDIEVEDGIEYFENYVFADMENLKSVKLPNTLEKMGEFTFCHDKNLLNVNIPDKIIKVERYTFCDCHNLKNIILPESITCIDGLAFTDCHLIENITIPSSVVKIGEFAFRNCFSLKSITIPDNVKEIGNSVFFNCERLETVNLPDNLQKISNSLFAYNTYLKDIKLPSSLNVIGKSAFSHCKRLNTIDIPDSVKYIGDYAFEECDCLTDVNMPKNLIYSGEYAFINTKWLESKQQENPLVVINNVLIDGTATKNKIVIPDGVKIIPPFCFNNRYKIKSITIPNSIEYIDAKSFYNHSNLTIYYNGTKNEFNKIEKKPPIVEENENKSLVEIKTKYFANDECCKNLNMHIICTKNIENIITNIENVNIEDISFDTDYEKEYSLSQLKTEIHKSQDLNKKLKLLSVCDTIVKHENDEIIKEYNDIEK